MQNMLPLWNSAELRSATQGILEADVFVQNISLDTRHIQKHDLFIALKGENFDGHDYIAQAFKQGASCVIADNLDKLPQPHDPRILHVKNSFEALENLGKFARQRFQGCCIAITGSVGKTTTKEMLLLALSSYGKTHASAASYNNHYGVPLTLARLPADADYCISEVGMNHQGEIAPLAKQIKPHYALLTTIGTAHLGHMGSIEAIAKEKASLFSSLLPNGVAITPYLPEFISLFKKALPPHCSLSFCHFEEESKEMPFISHLSTLAEKTSFDFNIKERCYQAFLPAPGKHLAQNMALILTLLDAIALPLEPALKALQNFHPGAGRGHLRKLKNGVILLDESYNASKASMIAALETLSLLSTKRHIAALGDIRELGAFSEQEHLALLPTLIKHQILCFCCGKYMKSLYKALPKSLQGGYAINSEQLAPLVRDHLHIDDSLLVKGSLGSQMRTIITTLDSDGNLSSSMVK